MTIGENYHLLQSCAILQHAGIQIEFVGLDLDARAVAFAQDIFKGDQNFTAVTGEMSDLSRFPDRCFDIVVSRAVHNYAFDQLAAVREALRVSRVATVFYMAMTEKHPGVEFSHATTSRHSGTVFKVPSMKEFLSMLDVTEFQHIYHLSRSWKVLMKIDNNFMGKFKGRPTEQNFVISRYPILQQL